MTLDVEKRYHPRVRVQWPTIFFTSRCCGYGTVVDVSPLAWRIQGSMPVHVGMQLAVMVWPQGFDNLAIEEATVLWVREQEFALEIYQVRAEDVFEMDRLQERTMGCCPGRRPHAVVGPLSRRRMITAPLRRPLGQILPHCHLRYWLSNGRHVATEEALLHDLSLGGCNFAGRAALRVGQVITVILYFADGEPPICLAGTTVCWATNHHFGVRFPQLTAHEQQRLQAALRNGPALSPALVEHHSTVEG